MKRIPKSYRFHQKTVFDIAEVKEMKQEMGEYLTDSQIIEKAMFDYWLKVGQELKEKGREKE